MARSLLIPRLYMGASSAGVGTLTPHAVWEDEDVVQTTLLTTTQNNGTSYGPSAANWSVIHDHLYYSGKYVLTGSVVFTGGTVRGQSMAAARYGIGIGAQGHQTQMVVRLYNSSDVLLATLLSPHEPAVIDSTKWANEGNHSQPIPHVNTMLPADALWADEYGALLEGTVTGVAGDYLLVEVGDRHIEPDGNHPVSSGSGMDIRNNKDVDLPANDSTSETDANSWIEFYSADEGAPPDPPDPGEEGAGLGYHVIVNEFADAETFGIGDLVADLDLFKYLGYAEYVNDVGEAFFTLNQDDPKAQLLRGLADRGGHVRIFRGPDLMWAGWLGETDEQYDDAVFYAYSYVAGLFERHTDWGQEWLGVTLDTIASDLWDRARTQQSRLGWMSAGTIEAPVTSSGGSVEYTQERYTAYYKRILFVMQEIVAAAMSDTSNRVLFEITPHGVFNLWKNRGTDLASKLWRWGDPRIVAYRRLRKPVEHRNVILGVGNTPRQATLRTTLVAAGDVTTQGGRREESVYFQWVRDQAELNRALKLRLARARRRDSTISLTFAPNSIVPFRATNAEYQLTDGVRVMIDNGSTQVDEVKWVVGQQVLLYDGEEIVRPLLADSLTEFDDGVRLAHGQYTNDSVVTTHPLVEPPLSVAANDVLLIAFIQVRADQAITLGAGWTQRVHINNAGGFGDDIGYILADKYVASDASPYDEDFTTGSAAYSHQTESIFKVNGPVTPVEFQSQTELWYPSFEANPTIEVTLGVTPNIGDLLIGYAAKTSATGSVDTGDIWPDSWTLLENIEGFAQIGQAEMYYKIAEGNEDSAPIQVISGETRTETMMLIVANYGPVDLTT